MSICDTAANTPVETHFTQHRVGEDVEDERGSVIPLSTVRILDTDTDAFVKRCNPIITTIRRSQFTTLREVGGTNKESYNPLAQYGSGSSVQTDRGHDSSHGGKDATDFLRELPFWEEPMLKGEGNLSCELKDRESRND